MPDEVNSPEMGQEPSADAAFEQEMEELLDSSDAVNMETLLNRIEELELEKEAILKETEEQRLRVLAESQNFRRRMQEQSDSTRRFATEQLVRELLPVLDNFDRTFAAIEGGATQESLLIGVRMIDKQIRAALQGQQVEKIEAVGLPFDPEVHEAIGTVSAEGVEPGSVVQELESGYKMHGRVLRASKVRVAE